MSAAATQLAQRKLKGDGICANCPHASGWHEQATHGARVGSRCRFPGCSCGSGAPRGQKRLHGYARRL